MMVAPACPLGATVAYVRHMDVVGVRVPQRVPTACRNAVASLHGEVPLDDLRPSGAAERGLSTQRSLQPYGPKSCRILGDPGPLA
jgi:hypothetical protein